MKHLAQRLGQAEQPRMLLLMISVLAGQRRSKRQRVYQSRTARCGLTNQLGMGATAWWSSTSERSAARGAVEPLHGHYFGAHSTQAGYLASASNYERSKELSQGYRSVNPFPLQISLQVAVRLLDLTELEDREVPICLLG